MTSEQFPRAAGEESGVRAHVTALLSVYDTRHHGFASIYHWTLRVFRAEIISVTPGLSNETLAVGSFTPIEAGALPLSPGFKDFVRDAFAVSNESATKPFYDP